MGDESTLVNFLSRIARGQRPPSRVPEALKAEARKAARRRAGDPATDGEDLVSAFLLSVLEERANGRRGADWDAMSESKAVAVVRRRLRQLACEQAEDWDEYRALRAHVRVALERGLPAPPPAKPRTVLAGDRICAALVAAAAAWAAAHEDADKDVDSMTAALRGYLLVRSWPSANDDEEQSDDRTGASEPAEADTHVEALRLAGALVEAMGPPNAHLFARRLADWGLKELGAAAHISTTTAFDRTRRAEKTAVAVIRQSDCTPEVARAALKKLMESAA